MKLRSDKNRKEYYYSLLKKKRRETVFAIIAIFILGIFTGIFIEKESSALAILSISFSLLLLVLVVVPVITKGTLPKLDKKPS